MHGQVSLASLHGVDGVLFVTDASQELTQPELRVPHLGAARCPTAAFVVTKTDLHRQWRRIVELNRAHLARAGIDIPVLPVSSFLRLRAVRQPELNEESGFAPLVEFLARDVVQGASLRSAATVAHEVDFVTSQLAHESDAERVVLAEPQDRPAVVDRLDQATRRAGALGAPDASWQQTLTDGVQDLASDIEHDLQARLREVLRGVRELIDQTDPRTSWPDIERWLRREVAAAGVANRDLLIGRAEELAEVVSTQFDLDAGEAVELDLDHITRALEERHLPSAASLAMPGGRLQSMMITARTTALVPMVAFSLVGAGFASLSVVLAPAALLTMGIGGKLLRDEGKRQRSHRQNQAKAAASKFVDEVAFEMNKETRDALRRTQRRLRDEFQARAKTLQASAAGALTAAHRAAALLPEARSRRTTELQQEATRLAEIRGTLRSVSTSAEPALVGSSPWLS